MWPLEPDRVAHAAVRRRSESAVTDAEGAPIEHSIWINARPADVFEYFVDPQKLVQWMGANASLDAAPGGTYEVGFKEGWISRGRFVIVNRPHRLVYTVGWEGNSDFPPGSTRVELTFAAERGGTRLRLRHYGPPSKGLESDGWGMYLERVTAVAEHRAPPGDPFEQLSRGSTRVNETS
jgi:uncharacterized protein YndB with AHSA1/START domain